MMPSSSSHAKAAMGTQKLSSLLLLLQAIIFVLPRSNAASTNNLLPNFFSNNPDNSKNSARSGDGLRRFIITVRRPEGFLHRLNSSKHEQHREWYTSLLSPLMAGVKNAVDGTKGLPRLMHSYTEVVSGFSARLTENELNALSKMEWFVNAIPDPLYKLHTTRTPEFLGLRRRRVGFLNDTKQGEGIIIGVLDSGIFPNHPSFSGEGMPPPPSKWKGRCDFDRHLCNNKLIGARSFISSDETDVSPIDHDGHGTHTASTAAGAPVSGASAFGNAAGMAAGMAPRAHLAAYKVCNGNGCYGSDVMAAIEAAIEDGVDVLSLSIGQGIASHFYEDAIAIGTFTAMSKGIFISASAGNEGPWEITLSNDAPWILTVAASTLDRRIVADVKLGNGVALKGESLNQLKGIPAGTPLIFPGNNGDEDTAACNNGTLADFDVLGKVVVCGRGVIGRVMKGSVVKEAGAVAMILMNGVTNGATTLADAHVLPASNVGYEEGLKLLSYINGTKNPTAAIIFNGTEVGTAVAPSIADFSSRGPSYISPGILKPDITGPGVSVLAAWHELEQNTKKPTFNLLSGTSMSCPHLSGIAALIKAAHPDWSPAAIKSAMMTTADVTNHRGEPITDERHQQADLYALGSGHVNPAKAMHPGLVYDLTADDYIPYLCGLGYNSSMVSVIATHDVNCSETGSITEAQLNYPSFSASLGVHETLVLNRTVTNVGKARQRYWAEMEAPAGVELSVEPKSLSFKKVNEKQSFAVMLKRTGKGPAKTMQGYLKWISGKRAVRSPILITFK